MTTIFKKWLIGVLVLAMLCTALPVSALLSTPATDLLTNGGFESGLEGWNISGDTALSDDAYSGDKALLLSHSSAWGEALTRIVAVEKNTDYTLSFRVKRVSGGGSWHSFVLDTSNWSALAAVKGQSWFSYMGSEWTTHSITVNSGERTAVMLKFCPESAGAGTFLIDDVSFTVKGDEPDIPDTPDTPDTPDQPVEWTNGGFEQGAEGWNVGGDSALSEDAHSGSQAMLMSHSSAWGEALTRTVAVEKNTDYVLTFWLKRVSGGGTWNVYALDPSTFAALPLTEGVGWFSDTSKAWVSHTVAFNSGDLTQIILKWCPESSSGGTFLIDDVSFTVKGDEPDNPDNPDTPDTPDNPDTPDQPVEWTNGGFEQGAEGWNVGGDSALSEDAHSGSQAMLMSHSSAWGEALTRTVAVEKNTDYVLTFWLKRVSGGGTWNVYALDPSTFAALPLTEGVGWFSDTSKAWISHTVAFNSGDLTQIILKWCPESSSGGTFLLDDVTLTVKGDEPDIPDDPVVPPAAALPLTAYGVSNCRPATEADNLIIGGGFDVTEGAQWNTDTFLSDAVTVVEDATRDDGYALYFNTSGTTKDEWHVFWVDVEPNTEYVFSAWLKGAFLSEENAARATVGVIDPDTQLFMVHKSTKFSNAQRQIVPTAWDEAWHLRAVSFHSGAKTRVGIALKGYGSQLWVDDISLHKSEDGVLYRTAIVNDSISSNYNVDVSTCKDEDNLLTDGHVDAGNDFWQTGNGWENGFLTLRESEYEYGTALKYTEHDNSVGVHYIKWVEVQPHTDYTFSADMRVITSGLGSLVLLDGKKTGVMPVEQLYFSQMIYGEDWFHVAFRFNSSSFSRVGIAVVDAGGEALLDNLRLFETADAYEVEDPYVEPPYIPEEDVDSPDTGVATAALAMAALLPASALTAFFCRKKKSR